MVPKTTVQNQNYGDFYQYHFEERQLNNTKLKIIKEIGQKTKI